MTAVTFTFRPLDHATWQDDGRAEYQSCRFKAAYSKTMRELQDELRLIGVREAVIEADVTEQQVRLDGQIRAGSSPASPRVRISFTHPEVGPLQYPCDTYSQWHDNIRAIVKTLEAQRAMDRYGATRRHQQYTGWKQLPGAIELDRAMTVEQAARFIAACPGWAEADEGIETCADFIIADSGLCRDAYRHACKRYHPDAGGTAEQFSKLQEAKRVLDHHHGGVA